MVILAAVVGFAGAVAERRAGRGRGDGHAHRSRTLDRPRLSRPLRPIHHRPDHDGDAARALERLGHAAETVANGEEAVDSVRQLPYDLILMDVQMPVMDGLEATRRIREVSDLNQVPIIAITANAFAEDREQCLKAGMNDFLTKPVDPKKLALVISQHLRKKP